MRISDWTSDVCSADLHAPQTFRMRIQGRQDVAVVGAEEARLNEYAMRDAVAVEQRKVVVQGRGGRRRVATVGIERRIRRPGMGVAIDDHGTSPDSGGRHKDNSDRKSTRLNSSH